MTDPATRDPAASLARCIELAAKVPMCADGPAAVAVRWLRDDAPALLEEVESLRLKVWSLERAHELAVETIKMRGDFIAAIANELRAAGCKADFDASPVVTNPRAEAAEQVARYALALLRDCNTVANVRGQLGVADCIDNDGQPYQSQHLADFLARHGT